MASVAADQNFLQGRLTIRLFGNLTLQRAGSTLPPARTRKSYWILALLLLNRSQNVDRVRLAEDLWPGSSQARNNLRTSLKDLRQILGPDADRIQSPNVRTLTLDTTDLDCDLFDFDAAIAKGDFTALEHAVTLYTGKLCDGCDIPQLLEAQQKRADNYAKALQTLARYSTNDKALLYQHRLVTYLKTLLAASPLEESLYQELIRTLAWMGDSAGIKREVEQLEKNLRRIGASPTVQTRDLERELLRKASGKKEVYLPPPRLAPLIGRSKEIETICTLLATTRLVTLTGIGGAGKTTIATEVAERLRVWSLDVLCFVPLMDVTSERLADAVRDGMQLPRLPNSDPFEQVVHKLSSGSSVLILDNFEHLVGNGTGFVRRLLERVPGLKILVTSRQVLGLGNREQKFTVHPLPVPEEQKERCVSEQERLHIGSFESVQLFLAGARARLPDFALTLENAASVAGICRRLDGLPLAIELASARVHLLTPGGILSQIHAGQFALLRSSEKDQDERHQTMWATMEWSFRLLEKPVQAFAARLSVFQGGWTMEAAGAVCDEPAVLDYLERLYDASLIVTEEQSGTVRYRYLETIRAYAAVCLQASHEYAIYRQRHFDYMHTWYEREHTNKDLDILERDLDNLRHALAWGCTDEEREHALLHLTTLTFGLVHSRSHFQEACGWFNVALAVAKDAPCALRMKALNAAAWCHYFVHDLVTATTYLQELREVAEQDKHDVYLVHAFAGLGAMARFSGDQVRAQALLTEGLALSYRANFTFGTAFIQGQLSGLACDQGDFETALTLGQESVQLQRTLGANWLMSIGLIYQGDYALLAGDASSALAHYNEALRISSDLHDRYYTARVLYSLGCLARFHGDLLLARKHYEESQSISRKVGDWITTLRSQRGLACVARKQGETDDACCRIAETVAPETEGKDERGNIPEALEALASLALTQGQQELAVRLLGSAEVGRETCRLAIPPVLRCDYDRCLAQLRAAFDTDHFARLWTEGRSLGSEQAISHALQHLSSSR